MPKANVSEDNEVADAVSDVSDAEDNSELSEETFDVEAIEDERRRGDKIQYYIKWKGYGREANTWEPQENLLQCQEALRQWEKTKRQKQQSGKKKKRTFADLDYDSQREEMPDTATTGKEKIVVVKGTDTKRRNGAVSEGSSAKGRSLVTSGKKSSDLAMVDYHRNSERASVADSLVSDAGTEESAEVPFVCPPVPLGKSKNKNNPAQRGKGTPGGSKSGKVLKHPSSKLQNGVSTSAKKLPNRSGAGSLEISNGIHGKRISVDREESPITGMEMSLTVPLKKPSAKKTVGDADTFRKPRPVSRTKPSVNQAKRKREISINRKGKECTNRGVQTEHIDDDPITCPIPPELAKENTQIEDLRSKALRVLRVQGILQRNKHSTTRPLDNDDALVVVVLDEGGGKEVAELFSKRVVRFVLPIQLIEFYEGHLNLPVSVRTFVPGA
ncbi:M-phase phosphoprotein 8-like isoform X2 [Paramacrobiotus metropolitanus]|uniref:M-phase phosphoprotein 8-like isoform X2 n=1 Tax=Paramacrobiotus metropolitanus TaxID=2943436 RepID=UPI0024464601|nr:M-phase phosphoprotein 8-like isoform X2 [Paramacrobiotus metropolitanus]